MMRVITQRLLGASALFHIVASTVVCMAFCAPSFAQSVITPCMKGSLPCQTARSPANNSVQLPVGVFNSMFPDYLPGMAHPDGPYGRGITPPGGYLQTIPNGIRVFNSVGEDTDFIFNSKAGRYESEFVARQDFPKLSKVGAQFQLLGEDGSVVVYGGPGAQKGSILAPSQAKDPHGRVLFSASYNPATLAPTKITTAASGVTTFSSDGSGRVTSMTTSDGQKYQLSYSPKGELTTIQSTGFKQTLAYDLNGNITSISINSGGAIDNAFFTYADHNVLTGIGDAQGKATALSYTDKTVISKDVNSGAFSKKEYQTFFGKLSVPVRWDLGTGSADQSGMLQFAATLNSLGLPTSITDSMGQVTKYSYDGQYVKEIIEPPGLKTTVSRDPKNDNRITSVQQGEVSSSLRWQGAKLASLSRAVAGNEVSSMEISPAPSGDTTKERNTIYISYDQSSPRKGSIGSVTTTTGVTTLRRATDGTLSSVVENGITTTFSTNIASDGTLDNVARQGGLAWTFTSSPSGKIERVFGKSDGSIVNTHTMTTKGGATKGSVDIVTTATTSDAMTTGKRTADWNVTGPGARSVKGGVSK